MKTIAQQWDIFEKSVLPPHASRIQRQEMRRAFYAGTHSMMMTMAVTTDLPEEKAIDWMNSWKKELDQFLVDMQAGKV